MSVEGRARVTQSASKIAMQLTIMATMRNVARRSSRSADESTSSVACATLRTGDLSGTGGRL